MKKFFAFAIFAAALLLAGKSNAQLGIHVGYSPETWGTADDPTELNSFFVGVEDNFTLSGDLKLAIGVGARYGTKSGNGNIFGGVVNGEYATTLVGIDVPVLFNYTLHLSKDLSLSVFVGPKVTYTLSGNTHWKSSIAGILNPEGDIDWFGTTGLDRNYKQLNVSGTAGVSINYHQYRLFGGYNYGLLDIDNNDNTKTTVNGLYFGVGMLL